MCFRVHTTLERFSLSLSVSEAMEVCTSNTLSPQVQPMEVCVCAHSGSALFSYAWLWILSYIRTYFHRVYVDSIYPLSKESSVCVCVCVWIYVSLSPSNGGVCAPSPSPSLIPSFPIPFSLFFPYTPLSLSLSMSYYHMSPTLLLLVSLILFPSAATEP